MKAIKYVMMGALMLGISAPVFAQTGDPKADTETITKMIKGKSGDVAEMSKKYAKKYKKNTEVLLAMSKAYYEVKDTANARIMAENALKADKKCAKAFIMLGDIQALSDDGGGAAGQYQQAIYFDPKDPEAYYKYANVYKKVSPSEAVAKLEELRTHRPDIAVDALAGRIYYTSNKFGNAIDCYSKAWAEKDKMEERDIRDFAMAYYLTGKAANALEVAKFGLTKAPRDAAFNRLAFFTSSDTKQYEQALEEAFRWEDEVVVEQYIQGREFSVCVIDGKALPIIEIAPISGFYDYKNKYQAGSTRETCPAQIPDIQAKEMQGYAELAAQVIGLDTYSRMDFLMDDDGRMYCLEANTLPGMTPTSLIPQEAAAVGVSYNELCEQLIQISLQKMEKRS